MKWSADIVPYKKVVFFTQDKAECLKYWHTINTQSYKVVCFPHFKDVEIQGAWMLSVRQRCCNIRLSRNNGGNIMLEACSFSNSVLSDLQVFP